MVENKDEVQAVVVGCRKVNHRVMYPEKLNNIIRVC